MLARLKRAVLGGPRDVQDPGTFHAISLVALLAWVGLGADGLSSSAYGPDEAFRALGEHTYLAVALAGATAVTVLVISVAYSQIIRRFPFGGGGYVVATQLLGPRWGVVSGSALLIDYVLTISVSIAGGLAMHAGDVPRLAGEVRSGFRGGVEALGAAGLFAVFVRAYSMGAGTYTGIEAVSNGLQIMREPRVRTGRRTMTLMAVSLALTAGGILLL